MGHAEGRQNQAQATDTNKRCHRAGTSRSAKQHRRLHVGQDLAPAQPVLLRSNSAKTWTAPRKQSREQRVRSPTKSYQKVTKWSLPLSAASGTLRVPHARGSGQTQRSPRERNLARIGGDPAWRNTRQEAKDLGSLHPPLKSSGRSDCSSLRRAGCRDAQSSKQVPPSPHEKRISRTETGPAEQSSEPESSAPISPPQGQTRRAPNEQSFGRRYQIKAQEVQSRQDRSHLSEASEGCGRPGLDAVQDCQEKAKSNASHSEHHKTPPWHILEVTREIRE